jgi:hypothetical protein
VELGAGTGASIYGLNKLIGEVDIDCVELNYNDKIFLQERFSVKVYDDIINSSKIYNVIFGHHVFEHFVDPRLVLNKMDQMSSADCKVYFSLPNFDDYYRNTLKNDERNKYLEFNFHLAHPYYYTIDTFSKLIKTTIWEIDFISTIQYYSIVNFFNWYINGVKSKNIEEGTKVDSNIKLLNDNFISAVEGCDMGNNLSIVLKKKR